MLPCFFRKLPLFCGKSQAKKEKIYMCVNNIRRLCADPAQIIFLEKSFILREMASEKREYGC